MIHLSPSEQRLFALLSGNPVSTAELAKQFWRGKERPFNDRIIIARLARDLVKKTRQTSPRVKRTPRSGPISTSVWLEQ